MVSAASRPGEPSSADHAAQRLALARAVAGSVADPEIPVINLEELGILRDVQLLDETVIVTLTPTYTGCPATEVISSQVRDALADAGFQTVQIRMALAPAWTTDWITPAGRRKLLDYGIAPPLPRQVDGEQAVVRFVNRAGAPGKTRPTPPACPQCGANESVLISEYGSTPCKAIYRCGYCYEPFDYFKPY